IDISMSELTAVQIAELIGVDPAEAYRAPDVGGDFFLRLASGGLLAVTLRDADEVSRLEGVLGAPLPQIATKGQLLNMAQPVADHLPPRLLEQGFAVAPVVTAPELARDQFVRGTGLFQIVESSALGRYEVTGLPWQFLDGRGARTPV